MAEENCIIIWSVNQMQRVKIQKLQKKHGRIMLNHQNVQCVIFKNWNLLKSKKIADC